MKKLSKVVLTDEVVVSKIFLIRGQRVMLDRDLAPLYGVTTGNLNKAVKRNQKRFPEDFMFQLTIKELRNLIFQIGISSLSDDQARWGGVRKMPYAFTEQGVAMLSSVLNSEQAIAVNIHIVRVFTRMRELQLSHKDLLLKIEMMEGNILNMVAGSKSTTNKCSRSLPL